LQSNMLQIPLKWQLPAPKCCKSQGKQTEEEMRGSQKEQLLYLWSPPWQSFVIVSDISSESMCDILTF
jgi:hypothetical protein